MNWSETAKDDRIGRMFGSAPALRWPCVRESKTDSDTEDDFHVDIVPAEFPHPSQFGPPEYWQASDFTEKLAQAFSEYHRRTSGMLAKVVLAKSVLRFHALIGGESKEYPCLGDKFLALVKAWEDHNRARSVMDYDHVSYAQIIGMGERAIPLLMARLEQGEGDWIYALKCITGVQAETPDMHGDPDAVISAWLEWGKRNAHAYSNR
jgi:hypothetical protein